MQTSFLFGGIFSFQKQSLLCPGRMQASGPIPEAPGVGMLLELVPRVFCSSGCSDWLPHDHVTRLETGQDLS